MRSLQVDLPDKVAEEVDRIVQAGWFNNPADLVRAALTEFFADRRHELLEEFQREDIGWALSQKKTP